MGTWMNNDGLYIKYGADEGAAGKAGSYGTDLAGVHVVEVDINLTSLGTARAIQDDNVFVPAGVRIQKVEVINITAATGDNAVLNVGLVRRDRTTTYDDDGFVAALARTSFDAAGETAVLTAGVTGAGAFIGTTLANNGYIVADYDTAAFTAGVVKVRIHFQKL